MFVIKMIDLDFVGKCVFICVDLNVLVKDGKVIFDVCIFVLLFIIKYCLEVGVKVMVIFYLGCLMEGEYVEEFFLLFVVNYLNDVFDCEVCLVKDYLDGVELNVGELVVLENVCFNKGEKKNEEVLFKKYVVLCDVFVMDVFGIVYCV